MNRPLEPVKRPSESSSADDIMGKHSSTASQELSQKKNSPVWLSPAAASGLPAPVLYHVTELSASHFQLKSAHKAASGKGMLGKQSTVRKPLFNGA